MKMIGAGHHALKMLVAVTVRIVDHQAHRCQRVRGDAGECRPNYVSESSESVSNNVLDCGLRQFDIA